MKNSRRQFLRELTAASGICGASALIGTTAVAAGGRLHSVSEPVIRSRYLDTEDGQLHYWTAGNGPALLLVHQSGNSAEEYTGLVPYLAGRYRLIALDLPGHGNSDDPAREPSVDDYTRAATRVIDHLAIDRLHLLGHHGGALVAMNLAARQPERFDKVMLSGTSGLRSAEESQAFIDSLKKTDTTITRDSTFVTNAWDRYLGMKSSGARPADILKPYVAFLEARLRPYRAIFAYLRWDRSDALRALRGPVLLLQGSTDNYVSKQEELLEILPNARRIVLPGCGTFMFYDKPKECADAIVGYLDG